MKYLLVTLQTLVVLLVMPMANAVEYSYGGYGSLYAGTVVGGKESDWFKYAIGESDCPCYVSNFYDAAYYKDGEVSIKNDSVYGFRGQADFNKTYSIAAQIEGRGGNDFKPELTWLYARAEYLPGWTIDVGRKAIPLYHYSDYLNVKYAMNTVRVASNVYPWPIVGYDGISTNYEWDGGPFTYGISFWYGVGEEKNSREFSELFYVSDEFYVKWDNMMGTAFTISYDWIDVRLVYMESDLTEKVTYGDNTRVVTENAPQTFYGASIAADYDGYLFHMEIDALEHIRYSSVGYTVGTGIRFGTITPMVFYSNYTDKPLGTTNKADSSTYTAVIRWDFMTNMAFKAQYDHLIDDSSYHMRTPYGVQSGSFLGESKTVTVGIDYVF